MVNVLKFAAMLVIYLGLAYLIKIRRKNESIYCWITVTVIQALLLVDIQNMTSVVADALGIGFTMALGEILFGGLIFFCLCIVFSAIANWYFYREAGLAGTKSANKKRRSESSEADDAQDALHNPVQAPAPVFVLPSLWDKEQESLSQLTELSNADASDKPTDDFDRMLLGEKPVERENVRYDEELFEEIKELLGNGKNEDAAVYLKTLAYYGNDSGLSEAAKKMLNEIGD